MNEILDEIEEEVTSESIDFSFLLSKVDILERKHSENEQIQRDIREIDNAILSMMEQKENQEDVQKILSAIESIKD